MTEATETKIEAELEMDVLTLADFLSEHVHSNHDILYCPVYDGDTGKKFSRVDLVKTVDEDGDVTFELNLYE